ncbi:MAG TPA: branched-chain amino acid ABC transporter permease [Burkholderiales bacterium]|nr:branched-chain amino acid ABC transporter permease [Burkholderiales bacterium]
MVLIDLVQNSLDGLMLGSSYALLALGFTLIFGVLRRANLSYGPAIMVGAYAATWVHLNFHSGFLLLAAVTVAGAVVAGVYVERLCFAPYAGGRRRSPEAAAIASMVGSFALWMQLEEAATLALPKHLYDFPPFYAGPPLELGPFTLRVDYLAMLACAVAASLGLHRLLTRTRFGLGVRAVIDNADAARLAGVNVPRVFLSVFALASALGGLAGYLIVAAHEQVTPMLGMWSTLKGLIAMMLGGLGSLPGAVVGALALGLIEAHSQWVAGPQYRDLVAYLVLFALLALRPAGLWSVLRGRSAAAAA